MNSLNASEGKPDIRHREIIAQRECKRQGLAIRVPHAGDQSELSSTKSNTKPQLEAVVDNNVEGQRAREQQRHPHLEILPHSPGTIQWTFLSQYKR